MEKSIPLDKDHSYAEISLKIGRSDCGRFFFPKNGEENTDCEVTFKENIQISDDEKEESFKSPFTGVLILVTSKRTGQFLKIVG